MSVIGSSSQKGFQPDTDVHITYEDQQKINKFARQNAKLDDLKEELKSKQKQLQNLEDASSDLLMVENEDEAIPYQLGEVFVNQSLESTQQLLEETKSNLQSEITSLEEQCDVIKGIMSDLKVQLYAKFGNNINLDAEDD
ncbi:hypothetical protein CHUAL_011757 [Chamberlinius hualienensis]